MRAVCAAVLLAAGVCRATWIPLHDGPTSVAAAAATRVEFRLSGVDVQPAGGAAVSVAVPEWPTLGVEGEPDLPLIRSAVVLPHRKGTWSVVVSNVQTTVHPLPEGKVVRPAMASIPICAQQVSRAANFSAAAYRGVYPQSDAVSLDAPYTWRDVYGAVVQILPVTVDHTAGTMEILHSCTIDIVSTEDAPRAATKRVDPDFFGAYSFVYSNFAHVADMYTPDDKVGRVLVVYESQFKAQAQEYADWVKRQWSQDSVLHQCKTSHKAISSAIKTAYKADAGLSYVMLIGRDVPTPKGPHTHKECDNCYAMVSGSTLDLFVGRLSGASTGHINRQLAKIKAYNSTGTAAWNERAFATANYDPPEPALHIMQSMMKELGAMGFKQHDYINAGTSGAAKHTLKQFNAGIGVFGYIGHGGGKRWDTPTITNKDIQRLTNTDMPTFIMDCSCLNGGFQWKTLDGEPPCLAETLMESKGGAIATMMSAPEIDDCCDDYLRAAPKVLKSGKVSRVGPVYVAALTQAQVAKPDKKRTESYNVFGDPVLKLAFAKGKDA